jgi:hypothetical protein
MAGEASSALLRVVGPFDSAALAFFARLTTYPTPTRARQYNTVFVGLRSAGLLAKLDALYLMAAADSQAARQNLIQNAYNLTAVNAPTFTADQGYTGDGSSSYLTTGFTPSTAGGKYALNSAHLGAYLLTNVTGDKISIGNANNPYSNLRPRFTSDTFNLALNSAGGFTSANGVAPTSVGLTIGSRLSSATGNIFKGGTDFGGALFSTGITSSVMQLLGVTGTFSDAKIAVGSIGGGLLLAESVSMQSILDTYLHAVGAI